MITKSRFDDWKNQDVTQAMYEDIKEAAEEIASEMLVRRESLPEDDQYLKGFIRGVQAAMEWSPEIIEEDDDGQS